jgi:hypothetical protein
MGMGKAIPLKMGKINYSTRLFLFSESVDGAIAQEQGPKACRSVPPLTKKRTGGVCSGEIGFFA